MSFTDISDNELIYLTRIENKEAKDYLIDRYKKRIYGIINSYFKKYGLTGIDYEDYYQDCFIVFLKCLNGFDNEHNFYNYLSNAVIRKLSFLLKQKRQRDSILSLDYNKDDFNSSLIDTIEDEKEIYCDNRLEKFIEKRFDFTSKQIIDYKSRGYSYFEISEILNIDVKTLYRKLYKIRDVVKREYKL